MSVARWIVLVGFLATATILDGTVGASEAGDMRLAQRSDDINVNPYGDPIWQQHAKPTRHKPQRHVRHAASRASRQAQTKHRLHAKPIRASSRLTRPNRVGKPLDIKPPAAR